MKQLFKPGRLAERGGTTDDLLETDAAYHTPKAKSISIESPLKVWWPAAVNYIWKVREEGF